jgi:hypothetical protein
MKFITIRSFDDYISAHIIMGRLKEENIVCHLQDEHTATTAPFLTNLSGGIKLMVPEPQAERALELLEEFENNPGS